MRASARIGNSHQQHSLDVQTGDRVTRIPISPKPAGFGSAVTGGEMLMAALATCYCNDVYREAARLGIEVTRVEVECSAEFPAEGAPASDVRYSTRITAKAAAEQIRALAEAADRMAEVQNTVRGATTVRLERVETVSA